MSITSRMSDHAFSDVGKPMVLVVDDQVSNIQTVGTLLSRSGFDVMPATSGAQALERASLRTPDLILLDVLMPGMDGFAVLAELRARPGMIAVPVIFLTAANERELLVRAFDAGAVDYVTKPFVAEELLARVRTHVELKQMRDHLERIARERADLTQIVAHDLKGPLSAIQFSASMLGQQTAQDSSRVHGLIESIVQSADEALQFIQGYLGRWADGELRRRHNPVALDLRPLCERVVDAYQLAAESRQILLTLDLRGEPIVHADATATRHVLGNIISNAIKYGQPASSIDILVGPGRAGFCKLSVLDRGAGISQADQQKLFRRYVRLGSIDPDQRTESSGLGLAIAKQEVDQMGGSLWYEDRPGGGAVFSFELPIEREVGSE